MTTLRKALLLLAVLPLPLALASPGAPAAKAAPAAKGARAAADCHPPAAAAPAPAAKAAAARGPAQQGWVLTRGAALKGAPAVTLAQLLHAPQAHAGKTVQVEGQVRKACERKGCWLELAEGETGAGVRVTFKDYGFFVPLDAAGASARVEGVVRVAELSEARAEHYRSEGATVPRGQDGKAREVQLVASGVELRR